MSSIRLSLIVYFLLLLAAALGAVSLFVYQTTHNTLTAKREATRQLLQAQYAYRSQEVRDQFDKALLNRVRTLATLTRSQSQMSRAGNVRFLPTGLLGACAVPQGHFLVPLWLAEAIPSFGRNDLSWRLGMLAALQIQFNEDDLPHDADDPPIGFLQVNSAWGGTWRSRSMGSYGLPFDREAFEHEEMFAIHWDEVFLQTIGHEPGAELTPAVPVRRVTLKAPITRFRFELPSTRRGPPTPGPERRPQPRGPRPEFGESSSQAVSFQCASETTARDDELKALQTQLETDLEELDAESDANMVALRNRLLWISLGTFAAAVLGGCLLVGVGLAPLRRLTDAVSRVSEKDFRLPLDGKRLPGELSPIAERLQQTLTMLQRAFAREKQAAADISHELRTPLAALLTTVEVALRKPRSSEEYRETLGDCLKTGQRMSQLVERLLALARLDANVDTLRLRDVDAATLAQQCADLVRPLAEARGLCLSVQRNGPAPLKVDADKLREVVTNLLHNAIEYNRPNGSVNLSVKRQNGHLCVEVSDTGIGIAPAAREQIFERFYRADPSRSAEGLHAGLGLSIVKGYIDLMGGSIAVESAEGQGTTFRVRLPA